MIATASKSKPTQKKAAGNATPARAVFNAKLPIAAIDPHPANPRVEFDQAELDSLAASIKANGLLQPIVVRAMGAARYQVIAGGRRLLAAKAAGWKSVPATIREATDAEAFTLALIENVDRCDLNPIETARAVARLCAPEADGGGGMTQVAAGEAMSRDASWVRRQIQLLELPDCWLRRVATGELNVGMSRALLPYAKRPSVLGRIEDDMLANPWSWRTADDFERNAKMIAGDASGKATTPAVRELKPMRAAHGTGERKRESRAADGHHTSPAAGDDAAATLRVDRSVTPEPPASTSPATLVDVPRILAAIASIDEPADLARIAGAVEERRAAIKRLRRTSRASSATR